MKTIFQKLLICTFAVLLPVVVFAQYGYSGPDEIDVNGIFIGGQYTKAQIVAKWGGPTKYRSNLSESGLNEVYDYSINNINSQFMFGENGIFHTFVLETSTFIVYTAFDGGIKVGDSISRVQAIGLGTPELYKSGIYHLRRNNADDPIVFRVENGVIKQISFVSSI